MSERRRGSLIDPKVLVTSKSSPLPSDYLKMVTEVFTANFDAGLKALAKYKPNPRFEASGQVYANELLLSVSLSHPDHLSATTVHASCDFDPKASSPTIQDLLAACVDAIGSLYGQLLDPTSPERLEQLASESLSSFEDVPFNWTSLEVEKHTIWLKIDKSNPKLDQMADDWLRKNDPNTQEREEQEQKKTEDLFVTGPKKKIGGPGTTH